MFIWIILTNINHIGHKNGESFKIQEYIFHLLANRTMKIAFRKPHCQLKRIKVKNKNNFLVLLRKYFSSDEPTGRVSRIPRAPELHFVNH